MPYAPVRDLEIYYEWHGPEEAEPLFLLNGAFGVIGPDSDWSYQLPRLAEQYRVLTYEHRGHGRTRNPAQRFADYATLAEDALGLLDYLKVPKANMVGFSDGAITLLDLAQRYPDRVDILVLVGANYYNDQTCTEALKGLNPDYIEQNYSNWAETLEKQHGVQGPGYWKTLGHQLGLMWQNHPKYTKDDMSRITAPTLVMTGQRDPYGNVPQTLEIHQAIKGSELCILPGASHPVMSQRPEIATLIILDYLARQRKRRKKE